MNWFVIMEWATMINKRRVDSKALAWLIPLAAIVVLMAGACEPRPTDEKKSAKDKASEIKANSANDGPARKSPPANKTEFDPARVQDPLVAGAFYPGDKAELKDMIGRFLAATPELEGGVPGRPVGFMVPHAGYVYSGPVAAHVL